MVGGDEFQGQKIRQRQSLPAEGHMLFLKTSFKYFQYVC